MADEKREAVRVAEARRAPSEAKSNFRPSTTSAFSLFFISHILAVLYSPIQDCDEVFNYWEPTHYLTNGYGLQTWEYSPEYAIRSWAYAGLHAPIAKLGQLIPISDPKVAGFYIVRMALALVCAICEARLFSVIQRTMSTRIATVFTIIMTSSTGMFHASVAYLPSSFAMYCIMLGIAAFMDWRGGSRTAQGIFWFGVGGILGWPFASALVLPFVLEEVLIAAVIGDSIDAVKRVLDGTVRSLIVLAVEVAIDTFFYRKLAPVPLNIVVYNIFSGSGKGPNIYGTEPWHFYLRNLFLNFNVWLLLALASMPLLLFQRFISRQSTTRTSFLRIAFSLMPFYLWLGIMTPQPHKEERFMYPIYPALALNAAVSLHLVLSLIERSNSGSAMRKIPSRLRFITVVVLGLAAVTPSLLRTVGMSTAYIAPLQIYSPLQEQGAVHPGDTVCLGKEWYRFPSSYFLPDGVKAKFIKSEFAGLLPGEFSEAKIGFGFFPGAWLVPSGMNDENKEDPGKYTDIQHCTFIVDSHFPGTTPSALEPAYILDTGIWEKLKCANFLDAGRTNILARLIWIPNRSFIPKKYHRQWGDYCLLRRKR